MTNSRLLAPRFPTEIARPAAPFGGPPRDMAALIDPLGYRAALPVFGLPTRAGGQALNLDIDASERADAYEISAELPGVTDKDMAVTLDKGVLTIRGEKRAGEHHDRQKGHISERRYGIFQRAFVLPDDADEEGVSAEVTRGVLTITIPRVPHLKKHEARRIPVNAA